MLLLPACAPASNPDAPAADPAAVILTTSADYQTGAIATWTAAGVVTDSIFPTPPDSVLVTEGSTTFVLSRSSEDTVSRFDDGDFSAPVVQFSTGNATNPQDLATCGGRLFVALYSQDHLGVYDPDTGLSVGTVDLSAYDDGDGSPEADSVYAAPNGFLYVSLNQLDYDVTHASVDGSGTVVKVDCAAMTAVGAWDVGPNAHIADHPADPDVFFLYGGDYFLSDGSGPDLDGGIWSFDTRTDALSAPILTEEEAGANLGNIAVNADGFGILSMDDGYVWEVWCIDLADGTLTLAAEPSAFLSSSVAAPDGRVWVTQRAAFGVGGGTVGTVVYDPVACTASAPITTNLPPLAVGFLQ